MEDQANRSRTEISRIFNEVRQKVIERETMIKKQISETLEREQQLFKHKIG